MSRNEKKQSFWGTLPGIITAIGALLGASATLLSTLYTAKIIGSGENERQAVVVAENQLNTKSVVKAPNRSKPVFPSKVDRTNANKTAAAVLNAYRTRDVIALASLVNETNRGIFVELAGKGESHPRYSSIFSGWRWEGVQAWSGQIGEIRYRHYVGSARDEYQAHVKFGQLGPNEFLVVTLDWEDGKWCFEDIHSPTPKSFYSGSLSFKLGTAPY